MNVYEYVADNNPREANYMLSGYGYKKTQSKREISENLKSLVRKNKKEELILSLIEDKVTVSANEQMNFAGVSGQDMVQNLETNSYWTPNNPKRPISPDFFYNNNGIDEDALAEKISNQVKSEMDSKNNAIQNSQKQQELLDQIKAVGSANAMSSTPHSTNWQTKSSMNFNMNHIVLLGSALFVGYMVYSKLN